MGKGLILSVTLLAALAVVGSPVAAKTTIDVVVTDIPSGWKAEGQAAYETAMADFQQTNPDISVSMQIRSWGQAYLDFLITSAAAGTMPDVFQIGGNHQGALGKAGLLLPLNDFVSRWSGFNDFPPGVREDVMINGQIYGIPYRADVRLLQYNRADFDTAGLDRAKPPLTWDDIVHMGKKLTLRDAAGNILRAGFGLYGSEYYAPVWQAGGDFVVEANGKFDVVIDQPAAREGLEFIRSLVVEHQISQSGTRSVEGKRWGMEHGTASMQVRPEGHIRNLRDEVGIDLGVGQAIRHKVQAELVFINKWAISNFTRNADAGWRWIEYMSQRDVVSFVQYRTAGMPPRRSVAQIEPWARDEQYRAVFAAMAHVRPLPGAKCVTAADVRKVLIDTVKAVSSGGTPVSSAVDQAKQAITILLANE